MILVAGATGNLGGEICRRLRERGKLVRAIVRPTSDKARVAMLQEAGMETVNADLKDAASLEAACQGVNTVITTATTVLSTQPGDSIESVDLEGQNHLVDAARQSGVSRFIYTSVPANFDATFPLLRAKRSVEQHIKDSGLNYTILQPSYFMESWLGPFLGFDIANARVQIYGSGENKTSFISLRDVATYAVEAVDSPKAHNSTLPLGGPEQLSPLEVVQICEALSGRKFEVNFVPKEALEARRRAAEDSLGQSFAALMLTIAEGNIIETSQSLTEFRVQLTTVRDYAKEVLASTGKVAASTGSGL
jgi:uncharacterized protein YbjT (DUF2867 family)